MSYIKAIAEVEDAAKEINHEDNEQERLISETTSSMALLMMIKRQNRFNKGKSFNGFVLEQRSSDNNEFFDFLLLLKQNIKNIPLGTRIELAVVKQFCSPREDKYYLDKGLLYPHHWTAVDLYIDENGYVNSFVLDAANSIGYERIYARLKVNFPEGHHYVYKHDHYIVNQQKRERVIQTQNQGCSVFVMDHLTQLSQIDPLTLYQSELPSLVNKKNEVKLKNFKIKTPLLRIFRGMQSYSGLSSLEPEILDFPIKERNGKSITLGDYVKSQMNSEYKNVTISKKSKGYKFKKINYFNGLSHSTSIQIMLHRQGFTFIKNPILFDFCRVIALSKKEAMVNFATNLYQELNNNSYYFSSVPITNIFTVKASGNDINDESFKNEILLSILSLFKYLDENNMIKSKLILNAIINNLICILEQGKVQFIDNNHSYIKIKQNHDQLLDSDGRILPSKYNTIYPQKSLQKFNNQDANDLHLVTHLGQLELIQNCLKSDANVTQIGSDGWTPMMRAASAGRVDILKILYENNPQLHDIDIEHMSKAAYLATKYTHLEALNYLLKMGINPNSAARESGTIKPLIIAAAEQKWFAGINLLHANGANLELTDGNGNSLFHVAIINNDINLIEFLIRQNLDPNVRSDNGCSAVYLAALCNPCEERQSIIQALCSSNRIDLNAIDENGLTQFHLAAKNGDLSVLLVLLDLGVVLPHIDNVKQLKELINRALNDKQHMVAIGNGLFLLHKAGILTDCYAKSVIESTPYDGDFAEYLVELHEIGILTNTLCQELQQHIPNAFSISRALMDLHKYHMLNDKNKMMIFTHNPVNINVSDILLRLKLNNILNDQNFQVCICSSEHDFFKILILLNKHNILNDESRQALVNNAQFAIHLLNILRRIDTNIINQDNFLILAYNAVKIDVASQMLSSKGILNNANLQALLNVPDYAEEIAFVLILRKSQKINECLDARQHSNIPFFSKQKLINEIKALPNSNKTISSTNTPQ